MNIQFSFSIDTKSEDSLSKASTNTEDPKDLLVLLVLISDILVSINKLFS